MTNTQKQGYQAFTASGVQATLKPNRGDGFEFLNHTAYVVRRIIERNGVWRSERATAGRVRRLLENLRQLGYVERSDYSLGNYGYCWRLTALGEATK